MRSLKFASFGIAALAAVSAAAVLPLAAIAINKEETPAKSGKAAATRDPRADALLAKVAARYKQLKTLSGTVVTSSAASETPNATKSRFFLEKPNKMQMIQDGPDGRLTLIADGVNLWSQTDPVKPMLGARFRKEQADPIGYRYYIYGLPTGLRQFFDSRPELFTCSSRDVIYPQLLAPETIDGKKYQVVEMSAVDPAPSVTRLYIGDDMLIHRWSRAKSFESGSKAATVSTVEGMTVDATPPKDAYAYTPPAGEKVFVGLPYKGEELKIGSKAPDFTLPNPKGGEVSLSKLQGQKKVVLLHFFSVLCKPCHSEVRQAQQFVNRINSDKLAFVLIDEHETPELVNDFTTKHDFTATVGISEPPKHTAAGAKLKSDKMSMMDQYGVTLLPATYILDTDGTVLYYCFGFNEDEIAAVMKKLSLVPSTDKSRVATKAATK
jgi:peroxiredoxin